jgi:hypothetical protein
MFKPVPLNLKPYPFKLKEKEGQLFIFDELRKKELVLTPEEWVRQHFIQHLIHQKKYPKTLIKLEGGLKLNQLQKRTDILVFDLDGKPTILIECKANTVQIDQKVFDQIASYNIIHRVKYLVVTNGINHFYCLINYETKSYTFIEDLPNYCK